MRIALHHRAYCGFWATQKKSRTSRLGVVRETWPCSGERTLAGIGGLYLYLKIIDLQG